VNTNVGGENCHRGAALGALMGAAVGEKAIPASLIEVRSVGQDNCCSLIISQPGGGAGEGRMTALSISHQCRQASFSEVRGVSSGIDREIYSRSSGCSQRVPMVPCLSTHLSAIILLM
jgi:hypothetical protein